MRPARVGRSAVAILLGLELGGCGKQVLQATSPAPQTDLVVMPADTIQAEPQAAAPETRADAEPEPEPEALPKTWMGPVIPGLAFTDALRRARGARDGFARLSAPPHSAKDPVVKAWFAQAQAQVDQASRMYAAAFHAPDAPSEGRIDAIAEAAELDMTMARSLDEVGLGAMPVAWRSDPAVASTFEDIAVGPTRRWRDEARVLARQCVQTAHDQAVVTDAARRCASLRTGVAPKMAARDAGAGCACDPGDPLCSASLGGWCGK